MWGGNKRGGQPGNTSKKRVECKQIQRLRLITSRLMTSLLFIGLSCPLMPKNQLQKAL